MIVPPSLPLDILESILDELKYDRPSLRQCATVSRAFLHFSRKHLFRIIQLEYVSNRRPPCARLLAVVLDNPKIASFIQELSVDGRNWTVNEPTLPSLLHHIAEANTLQVFSIRTWNPITWVSLNSALQRSLFALLACTSLRSLSFSWSITHDIPLELIAIPPALQSLKFIHYARPSESEPTDPVKISSMLPAQHAQRSLQSLKLTGGSCSRLVRYLTHPLGPLGLSDLQTLQIVDDTGEMVGLAQEVVKVAATSLEHLTWQSRNYDGRNNDLDPAIAPMDLREVRKLHTLELLLDPYRYHCQLASRIVRDWGIPQCIERITLTFDCTPVDTWPENVAVDEIEKAMVSRDNQLDRDLAALCNKKRYPSLQKIVIELQFFTDLNTVNVSLMQSYIGKWFPRVNETGYLEASCSAI